jgi:hypothetical protein
VLHAHPLVIVFGDFRHDFSRSFEAQAVCISEVETGQALCYTKIRTVLIRPLKKAYLLRCAQPPRSNVLKSTPPLVAYSRALHLGPF